MGLDGVELIMAVEEKFEISILDEEAQQLRTVGDMKRLVRAKLDVTNGAGCLTQRAFHLIRKSAISEIGVQRRNLRPGTPLDAIIPKFNRRRNWEQFSAKIGVALPKLVLPHGVTVTLTALTLSILVATSWYGALGSSWAVVLAGLMAVAAIGWAWVRVTIPLKTHFQTGFDTVRDLCQFLVARHPQVLGKSRTTKWTEEEIWCLLRDVIMEQLAISQFEENSRFVEDLHVN